MMRIRHKLHHACLIASVIIFVNADLCKVLPSESASQVAANGNEDASVVQHLRRPHSLDIISPSRHPILGITDDHTMQQNHTSSSSDSWILLMIS